MMVNENLCLYCFEDMNGEQVCPHCGKDPNAAVPQIHLLPGTTVYHDRFLVGRSLGQDSSGIVYNALDTKKGNTLRIREYLPRNCAERLNDGAVVPIAGREDAFETGMRKLKASVETAEDPKKRHFYFEENGTAYIAQRRNAAAAEVSAVDDDMTDDDEPKKRTGLFIAAGAAFVAVAAVVVLLLLNNMNRNDVTVTVVPSSSAEADTTWLPLQTPTPTPYATPTFAALVDPELSWFDFTTAGTGSSASATATPKPQVDTSVSYTTIKNGSGTSSVRSLQQRLADLGWLSKSKVTGTYNADTTEAVKAFQTYVNENCSPAVKLTVDGIAGSKTQQWLYNSSVELRKPTATPKPTAKPTPAVTAAPASSVVNASSSASSIRRLQNKLIALGLMKEGTADGKYGAGTKAAVRNFQTRVNEILGYDVLEVSGVVDELTMAYIDYYINWWDEMQEATATPKPRTTPTPKPTATVKPTEAAGETIDASSSKKDIRQLQADLVSVGLLKSGDVDGSYGKKTVTAVKSFQEWVNTNRGAQTLKVTGTCDPMTRQYLDYCIENAIKAVELNTATTVPTEKPTQAPTEEPTKEPAKEPTQAPTEVPTAEPTAEPTPEPEPEIYEPGPGEGENDFTGINASSPVESITYMQGMLAGIRLLPNEDVTGNYGKETEEAVRLFQQFVNTVQGAGTLEETGICDSDTQQYLQYAYDRSWDVGTQMGVGTESGESEPEQEQETVPTIGPKSKKADIKRVQNMLIEVGLLSSANGKYDKKTEQAVLDAQKFINRVMGEGTLQEDGVCNAATQEYLRQASEAGWNMADVGETEEDEPADETDPWPSAEPEVPETAPAAQVTGFAITVNGEDAGDSVELDPGKYTIAWNAEGVESYSLYLYTQDGSLVNKQENTSAGGFKLDTAGMVAGQTYEIRVGAMPIGGRNEDMVWRSLYITLSMPAASEPEPEFDEPDPEIPQFTDTPEQDDEPEYEPAGQVGVPVLNIGSSVYQQGGVTYVNDDTVILTWMADGDVESYDVALIYEDGTRFTLGNTTDTSRTVSAAQLQPGMYTLAVTANAMRGGEPRSQQLTFAIPYNTTAEPEVSGDDAGQDANASYVNEEVRNIQMALYRYGLINPDNITEGVLDYETLAAVSEFQQLVNEQYGYNLPVLDPGSATAIDLETLNVLLNEKPSI